MTDAPQGPGWWVAADGRWYPPERHPGLRPTAQGGATAAWVAAVVVAAVVVVGLAGLALTRAGGEGTGTDERAGTAGGGGRPVPTTPVPPTTSGPLGPGPSVPGVPPTDPGTGSPPLDDPTLVDELALEVQVGAQDQGIAVTPAEATCVAQVYVDVFGAQEMRAALDSGAAALDALTIDDDPQQVLDLVNGVLRCAPQLLGE